MAVTDGPVESGRGEPIRVLLADDHPALRMGLAVLLNRTPGLLVVGEAASGEETLALLAQLTPQVAVLDCQLPGLDGAAVAAQARQRGWAVRILALSAYDDDRYLYDMWLAGAVGYLLKNEAPGRIVAAVQAAARGTVLWSPEQERRVHRWQAAVARVRASLTERECEVLRHIQAGLSNKELASVLGITERTVEFHVGNILRKLEVLSRVEAAVWASRHLQDG